LAEILIADTSEESQTLRRILSGHSLTIVRTLDDAKRVLEERRFDMMIATLHFDESRMFEFLRQAQQSLRNASTPVICFCSRKTAMSRLMHDSLQRCTAALGAWMYLDEHAYRDFKNADAELRRLIERCLTNFFRKEILQQRIDIQQQRLKIQKIRLQLKTQQWTPEANDYLASLINDLELLTQAIRHLQLSSEGHSASIEYSRQLKDRVSKQVRENEDLLFDLEETQSLRETRQSMLEKELAEAAYDIADGAPVRSRFLSVLADKVNKGSNHI